MRYSTLSLSIAGLILLLESVHSDSDGYFERRKSRSAKKKPPPKSSSESGEDSLEEAEQATLILEAAKVDVVNKPTTIYVPLPGRPENPNNCECGFHLEVQGSMTNDFGEEVPTVENDMPWQIWITILNTETSYEMKCGGSLINDKVIVTNAVCVEEFKNEPQRAQYFWDSRRINVSPTGKTGTDDPAAAKVSKVVIHPDYLKGKLEYQIALLVLDKSVPFSDEGGPRPVCLPAAQEPFQVGRDGVLAKWKGDVANLNDINEKIPQNEDYNSLYSTYDCVRMYDKLDNATALKHFCAGIRSNYTDKYFGTALMVEMASSQKLQIGILSSLYFTEKKIPDTTVNIFLKMTEVLPFIEEVSSGAGSLWCKHAVMVFNDSAPVSRLVDEKWLGTKSTNRVEDYSCVCGFKANALQGRIVGGVEANPYEYPWQTLLQISMDSSPMQTADCGGSIINDKFILTAAHCIFDQYKATDPESEKEVPVTSSANVKVQVMVHKAEGDPRAKILEVAKIHIHPEYVVDFKLGYQDYDIALLELKTPLSFWHPSGPLPVCLPSSFDKREYVGLNATVVGWGLTDVNNADSGAEKLMKLEVPIQPLSACKELSALEVTNRFLCAGTFDPNKDTLHGDSGGPLTVEFENGRGLQVGLVSWGDYERRKTEGLVTDISAALYMDISRPEVLSYIDYHTKTADVRWCKKAVTGDNPRRPWEGQPTIERNIDSKCFCGMPDESTPDQNPLKATAEFPWTVLIMKLNVPGTITYCVGTIINSMYVLTSARCLRNADPVTMHLRPAVSHQEVRVQLVKHETEKVKLKHSLKVSDVYIHPEFLNLEGDSFFDKNIGLLKMAKPFEFKDKFAPVCLPENGIDEDYARHQATLTGLKRTAKKQKKVEKKVSLETSDEKILATSHCGKVQRLGIVKEFVCTDPPKSKNKPKPISDGGSLTIDLPTMAMVQVAVLSPLGAKAKNGKHRFSSVKESLPFIEYFAKEANAVWCARPPPKKSQSKKNG